MTDTFLDENSSHTYGGWYIILSVSVQFTDSVVHRGPYEYDLFIVKTD